MAKFIGLDGYRGGWVAAWIDDRGAHDFDYSSDLERLLSIPHRRAMIDIPIGLPDTGYRNCDLQARAWLGPSVFPGARRGLWTFASQAAANEHYWSREGRGKGISCQLWNIGRKIKEVDDIITPRRQRVLCETHPELIFWTRNGRRPLKKKKSAMGRNRRIAILKKMGFKSIEDMLEWRFGTGIGRDDLIDACACAIAARDARSVIGEAWRDARGLRMEMHFWVARMPITIYGIKNCDTMKKARAWLDSHGVDYAFHDYKTAGIERERLERWVKKLGWEILLNRAGTTFKKLPDKDKQGVTEKKAIALMLAQPSMIKRPVLDLGGGKLLVGFAPDAYKKETPARA